MVPIAARSFLLAAFLAVGACDVPSDPPPQEDGEGPSLVLTFLDVGGRPIVRSFDPLPEEPNLQCGYAVGQEPGVAILSVSDPGGIDRYGLRLLRGNADFVAFTPAPPVGSTEVLDTGGSIVHTVKVSGTSTTVPTSALATFDLHGALPMSVRAFAVDRHGHATETFQFDIRSPNDAVICGPIG